MAHSGGGFDPPSVGGREISLAHHPGEVVTACPNRLAQWALAVYRRPASSSALRWSDVDLDAGALTVSRA